MIRSSNEFRRQVENVALSGSSIGVYSFGDDNDSELIANTVTDMFYNGINNKRKGHIINNISFYGTTNDWGYREVLYNNMPQIIVAIPEVLTAYNGDTYYLGNFDFLDVRKHKFHERDNGNITRLWFYDYMNHVDCFPCEFILGATIYDSKKKEASFILNPNFIGLQSEEEQTKVVSDIFKKYPQSLKNLGIKRINEDTSLDDYGKVCNEIESTSNENKAFYLKQYKEYLEDKYHFLYRKR